MKYLAFLFCSIAMIGHSFAQDQPSQSLTYCNVARNQQNIPIGGRVVTLQLSILKTSADGAIVYQEKHSPSTNFFGTFCVSIGSGTVQTGSLENIRWDIDNYLLKVNIDTTGGSDFSNTISIQQLHVPAALSKSGEGETRSGFKHYVGELYGGGVVFDSWKDAAGTEHGLIVALSDQSSSMPWSTRDSSIIGPSAQSVWNGVENTKAMLSQSAQPGAARLCHDYAGGGFSDWYLPSIAEIDLLFDNRDKIKKTLSKSGSELGLRIYWTSTEYLAGSAWVFATYGGPSNNFIFSKYSPFSVRAIRAF